MIGKTLHLNGVVGDGTFDEEAFTSVDVLLALQDLAAQDRITIHLNSPGGVATEGAAIYAMLDARPGGVDVVVEGVAASAASLIAMAGDTISMSPGSVMMIHDPSAFTFGNSEALSRTVEALEVLATAYAGIYASRSGQTPKQCREIMKAETWFSPEDAIETGFADAIARAPKAVAFAAFDYSKFKHAPQQLVALAREKNWTAAIETPPTKQPEKDRKMPKDNQAHAAATARIRAIMKADEADGRRQLAEHLAYETALTQDEALAIMCAAPKGETDSAMAYERHRLGEHDLGRRLNGEGLGYSSGWSTRRESRLVSSMKQRHGAK